MRSISAYLSNTEQDDLPRNQNQQCTVNSLVVWKGDRVAPRWQAVADHDLVENYQDIET